LVDREGTQTIGYRGLDAWIKAKELRVAVAREDPTNSEEWICSARYMGGYWIVKVIG